MTAQQTSLPAHLPLVHSVVSESPGIVQLPPSPNAAETHAPDWHLLPEPHGTFTVPQVPLLHVGIVWVLASKHVSAPLHGMLQQKLVPVLPPVPATQLPLSQSPVVVQVCPLFLPQWPAPSHEWLAVMQPGPCTPGAVAMHDPGDDPSQELQVPQPADVQQTPSVQVSPLTQSQLLVFTRQSDAGAHACPFTICDVQPPALSCKIVARRCAIAVG